MGVAVGWGVAVGSRVSFTVGVGACMNPSASLCCTRDSIVASKSGAGAGVRVGAAVGPHATTTTINSPNTPQYRSVTPNLLPRSIPVL